MALNTEHLLRTIATLEQATLALGRAGLSGIEYDLYRNAAIKSFELSLETVGKLLRKALKAYEGNPRAVDALPFKDLLRQAGKHTLLDMPGVERWLAYRDNRNTTAHDYGENFANETLKLLPSYIHDARELAKTLQRTFDETPD